MDNKQVTAEWIAQQRQISEIVNMTYEDAPGSVVPLLKQLEKSQTAALDALEASMQRDAEKDVEIARLKEAIKGWADDAVRHVDEVSRLTAERDAEKRRADAVKEIDLRPLQPGYMGVCTTDDEDGIQIRKVSHKHPQGRGYLDDDEDVQDVVVIRFADTAQVLAVVDRLLVLADAMAEKTRTTFANTDAPTGAESEADHAE